MPSSILEDLSHRNINLSEYLSGIGEEITQLESGENQPLTQNVSTVTISQPEQTTATDVSTVTISQPEQTTATDVRKAERARTKEVMSSEHYKGREELAQKMLFDTEMEATQIVEMLAAAPAQSNNATQTEQKQTNAFEQAMDKHGQTNVHAEENNEDEVAKTPVQVSNNIFDHFGFKKKGE